MNSAREPCKWGEECYRLHPVHFTQFSHIHLESIVDNVVGDITEVPSHCTPKISNDNFLKQLQIVKSILHSKMEVSTSCDKKRKNDGEMDANKRCRMYKDSLPTSSITINEKLKRSEPYRFFLTTVTLIPETHSEYLSVIFPDLLNSSLGKLTSSLQLNYMVEIDWLLAQYHISDNRGKPITIVYGVKDTYMENLVSKGKLPHVTTSVVKPSAFGHHHTKLMILSYADQSIRIIVSTANLIEDDWENRVQGVWISPALPYVNEDDNNSSDYDSSTGFKKDLLRYLRHYNLSTLLPWIKKVEKADFRQINVFFVSSVPGKFDQNTRYQWGHLALRKLLEKHVDLSHDGPENDSLICQCSSIGSLGQSCSSWFTDEFARSLSTHSSMQLNLNKTYKEISLIYPTLNNVVRSVEGMYGGSCLPYSQTTHSNQTWLERYFRQWKSDLRMRTKAVPHIKSYCRISPNTKRIAWFLLTSANLSKAAWGRTVSQNSLTMMSYEAGVLFLPKFLVDRNEFAITNDDCGEMNSFPLPYDFPLNPYDTGDTPFFSQNMMLRGK